MVLKLTCGRGSGGSGAGGCGHFLHSVGDVLVHFGLADLLDASGEGLGVGLNAGGLKELLDVIDGGVVVSSEN